MKKLSLFTTLAMAVSMAFTSCSKDDDPTVNEYTNGSQYTRNWEGSTDDPDRYTQPKLEDNGEYVYYTNGYDKAYFYYDEDGNVTKELIYKSYETSDATKKAFSELYGDTMEATDENGNKHSLNGTYIITDVAQSQIKFNTKDLVKKYAGPQLLTY